jgi:hypothetical protein
VPDGLSREHHLRRRAERVRTVLEGLWGEDLPGGPEPGLTVLVDAVALDDRHGTEEGIVVQGDGLGHEVLARLLADVRDPSTRQLVPPALRDRLAALAPPAERLIDLRASGEAALPSESSGAWEYDAAADTVSWDARSGDLCGLGRRPGVASLPEWSHRSVHEEDRSAVVAALRASAATGAPYDVRFRVPAPHRGAVVARGRVVDAPGGGARVLGFAAEDARVP